MSEAAPQRMSVEAFFAWQEKQSVRFELVGGVPLRMMAGAQNVHDDVVVNILGELRNQLRGGPCRPFTGDGSIETLPGQIRRPDIGVDCGRRDPHGLKAAAPRLVVEVLSPSTRDFDTAEKLVEYKSVAGLDFIMVVEPNAPDIVLWSRQTSREWERSVVEGTEAVVELPSLGVTLKLRDIYEGVEFPTQPRLVRSEAGEDGSV